MKDHPLVTELMLEMLMLDGQPLPPPRHMIDRFMSRATALERGEEVFALVRNVGALASAMEAAGYKKVCEALVSTLPTLLGRLKTLAEADISARDQAERNATKKGKDALTAGTALQPARSSGAGIRSRKGH